MSGLYTRTDAAIEEALGFRAQAAVGICLIYWVLTDLIVTDERHAIIIVDVT